MDPIAVIDVETTGLNPYRHDRIIEVTVVLLEPAEGILSTMETLVNPGRDIGPSRIHGLTATDILQAPAFADVAGHVSGVLKSAAALAGHNLRFDISFLRAEFGRLGIKMPYYERLDTMALSGGGTLSACCAKYGIAPEGNAHSALNDARATAELLRYIISERPDLIAQCQTLRPPQWPHVRPATKPLVSRVAVHKLENEPLGYIQRLAKSLSPSSTQSLPAGAERDYRSLLWNVIDDGRVEEDEANALVEMATRWGLDFETVERIHLDYLTILAQQAWEDRRLTEAERAEIQLAARLLGFGTLSTKQLEDLLVSTEAPQMSACPPPQTTDWCGLTVCFTGECSCFISGAPITRSEAERMAADRGLEVRNSVTKKLDILVVADPNTQSGKARKARSYGIRIIHEPRFWRELGVEVD